MTYDLRRQPWIPWRRRSGSVEWGPPAMLVSRLCDDPVVALATPRPDFNGAMQEFLIGLLTAALEPADERAWKAQWENPPGEAELQDAIDALPDAFDLEGDGARCFQDCSASELAGADEKPIDQLLIDSPGDQGVTLNKDLFVKRARVERLGRPAAAMALVTMQTYAPAGGQGHRTSLRGGGPLTTLIDPRVDAGGELRAHQQPLWQKLWANVETRDQLAARAPADAPFDVPTAFPWLAPTRTSNHKKGGLATTPADVHPLQAYFGMPRRIRLEFGAAGTCELTGRADDRTVMAFRTVNYGVQYEGWEHPLSPYYRTKLTEPWLPVHGQPGGVTWRDWLALTFEARATELREPARVVAEFALRRARTVGRREVRLHVFGYDMDNMKARGWTEATLPVLATGNIERRRAMHDVAHAMIDATGMAGAALLVAVKAALFQSPDDASGDFGQVKLDLWAATERDFYDAVRALADESLDESATFARVDELKRGFITILERAATGVFDRWGPVAGLDVAGLRRRVTARYQLTSALRGYSKMGEAIFAALGVAPPGGGRTARAAKKSKTTRGRRTT